MNGREASRLGKTRARERRAELAAAASVDPAPRVRRSTRATGDNPRARNASPRQQGTNPTAGLASDVARVARMRRQALARHYVTTGERWCLHCDDTGWIRPVDSAHVEACDSHRAMTSSEAYWILHPGED